MECDVHPREARQQLKLCTHILRFLRRLVSVRASSRGSSYSSCRNNAWPSPSVVAQQKDKTTFHMLCQPNALRTVARRAPSPFPLRNSVRRVNQRLSSSLAVWAGSNAVHPIRLEVAIWLIPSLIENAIAVAVVGLLPGPMFPILTNHSTTILPRWLITDCAGYITGAGQAGSAVLPFLTGPLASKFGVASLQPL